MNLINTGITYQGVEIYRDDVDYGNLTKRSHRARKTTYHEGVCLPCLEWGSAAVVLQFDLDALFYWSLEQWWEDEYNRLGEDFDVELFLDESSKLIELRFLSKMCYYTSPKKEYNTILNDIAGNVAITVEKLPKWITEKTEIIVLSDWEFLEYAEENKQ